MYKPWETVRLIDCVAMEFSGEWGDEPTPISNALVLRSTNIDDDGHVDLAGGAPRKVTGSKLSQKKLADGDILLEASGGSIDRPVGRTAIFFSDGQADYLCSNFFRTLRPKPSIHSKFLAWHLLRFYRTPEIHRCQQQTTGIINLKVKEYLKHEFALPPSKEQQYIAEILDTLDEAIRNTEKLIAKLQLAKQGLLHDLLTCGIDDNGELRDPELNPEQFKDSVFEKIPVAWQSTTLGKLVSQDRPIAYGILMPGRGYPGGVPVIKVKDIYDGYIDETDLLLTSPALDYEYRRSRLIEGDLLFTIRGSVGRMAIVPSSLGGANITQDTARIGLVGAHASFVRHYLEMPTPKRFVEVHTIGQAVKGINLGELRKVPLVLPPLNEQVAIARQIDESVARIDCESEVVLKLSAIKQGLMDDLLTGRVRVPLDMKATA